MTEKEILKQILFGLDEIRDGIAKLIDMAGASEAQEKILSDRAECQSEERDESVKPEITLDTVRELMVEKTRQGKGGEVKNILKAFQVEKLSELPAEHYGEVIMMASKLGSMRR